MLVFEMSQEIVKIHVILDMMDVCLPLIVCYTKQDAAPASQKKLPQGDISHQNLVPG